LKKDVPYTWGEKRDNYFEEIKQISAPILVSLEYTKYFTIYLFASKDIISLVLMQKDDGGNEKPITFIIKSLCDVEVRYTLTEK